MAANNGGDKGTRNLVIVMVSFIVVVGVVFSLISNRSSTTAAIPASVSSDDGYGIVLNPNTKPTIDVYVDYQCPACRAFEIINGGYLNEVIAQNKAKVVFHPMTFIGPESILAANAAACAADENEFMAMNLALFQDQSAEENSGKWQGDALLNIGKSIGINSAKFETCIKDGSYVNWTGNVATATAKADVNGTPTIFVNGKELDRSKENNEYGDPVKFRAALAAGGVK
jgi:protein-disulfide isomerase